MDSLRSLHARLAALTRHRAPNDPELVATREELARCKAQTRELRARIGGMSPSKCAQLLTTSERATTGV
ncbi:hypothetical protein OIA45_49145 (plasmid) [Streptomyces chartreusis]|uniref:hypothetical protein n=1 Tax=Streptomyces chartreusis TaxID=1969 RepID=UPI003864D24F|nr:hypothetical protein OIA45_49145 [Streptomyces chartreusis]